MEWVPIALVTFKILVLGAGMFYAVKWHYDQGNKNKDRKSEMRAVLRASGMASAVFMLGLLVVGFFTFALCRALGVDLTYP